jgi:hypothetical protein
LFISRFEASKGKKEVGEEGISVYAATERNGIVRTLRVRGKRIFIEEDSLRF